jgi:transcriptional regulator with XRE-family HTH domain
MKISLKGARANANLTQKQVAEKLCVSNKTVCNWEKGISFPDAMQIPKICDLYKVSYDDIIFLPNNSL